MASYAGVPLLTPTAAQEALVASTFDPLEIHAGFRAPFARRVPLNVLHWPWGASRWAEGWYLCDSDQLATIEARGALHAETGAGLIWTDGTTSLSAQMRCLTPRPLFGDPTKDRLWLLILVDDRYFWWDRMIGELGEAVAGSWLGLLLQAQEILGVRIQGLDLLVNYLESFGDPPPSVVSLEERLPILLDKIGWATQLRLSRFLGGGEPVFWSARQAESQRFFRLTGAAQVYAGGQHDLVPLPATARMAFPRTNDGAPARELYVIEQAAPEGTYTRPGVVTYFSTAVAAFAAGNSSPVNSAELHAIADQWLGGWYVWRTLSHDVRYAGVYNWAPEATSDLEYADSYTRAVSRHDDADLAYQDAGEGASAGDANNYYNTTFVIDTTKITVNNSTWYFTGTNNWYLGGPLIFNGPSPIILNLPVKFYDGWWLHETTYDFSGSAQEDDLELTTDRVVVRCVLDRDCRLTGMTFTEDGGSGQVRWVVNASTFKLTIAHFDGDSDAVNQFCCPNASDIDLDPFGGVVVWYDPTSGFHRVVGFCCGSGGGGGSEIIAVKYVPSTEATTSTTYTDLATADTVTFTLAAATNVVIEYQAQITLPASAMSPEQGWNEMLVDGSPVASTTIGNSLSGGGLAACVQYYGGLGSGSHTVDIKHKTTGGTSVSWVDRVLKVTTVP